MAIANLTLNTVTYTYASDVAGVITWLATAGGIPTGFSPVTLALRNPAKFGSPYRLDLRMALPVVATADSACSCTGAVLRSENVRIIAEIPDSGTTAERTDFGLRVKDLVANAQVQAALASLTRPG